MARMSSASAMVLTYAARLMWPQRCGAVFMVAPFPAVHRPVARHGPGGPGLTSYRWLVLVRFVVVVVAVVVRLHSAVRRPLDGGLPVRGPRGRVEHGRRDVLLVVHRPSDPWLTVAVQVDVPGTAVPPTVTSLSVGLVQPVIRPQAVHGVAVVTGPVEPFPVSRRGPTVRVEAVDVVTLTVDTVTVAVVPGVVPVRPVDQLGPIPALHHADQGLIPAGQVFGVERTVDTLAIPALTGDHKLRQDRLHHVLELIAIARHACGPYSTVHQFLKGPALLSGVPGQDGPALFGGHDRSLPCPRTVRGHCAPVSHDSSPGPSMCYSNQPPPVLTRCSAVITCSRYVTPYPLRSATLLTNAMTASVSPWTSAAIAANRSRCAARVAAFSSSRACARSASSSAVLAAMAA